MGGQGSEGVWGGLGSRGSRVARIRGQLGSGVSVRVRGLLGVNVKNTLLRCSGAQDIEKIENIEKKIECSFFWGTVSGPGGENFTWG